MGRTSFRAVKSKRDYIKSTTTHTNWLYLSRLAALKEHAFMKALGDNGFPVPTAVDVNRHAVLMSLIDGTPLTQRYKCSDPGRVYAQCVEQLANLARCGLVHCDFNEFNIMCNDDLDITIIDFPQMVSSNHPNAEELFVRDLKCLHKFFLRRFNYRADEDPNGVQDPKFFDVAAGGVGHGAGEGVEKSLDVSLRASGFTAAAGRDLEEYNAARVAQRDAEEGVDQDARRDENDDEDENHRHASAFDSSDDDFEGQRGGDERSRFGYVERGEEEVEEGARAPRPRGRRGRISRLPRRPRRRWRDCTVPGVRSRPSTRRVRRSTRGWRATYPPGLARIPPSTTRGKAVVRRNGRAAPRRRRRRPRDAVDRTGTPCPWDGLRCSRLDLGRMPGTIRSWSGRG